MENARTKQDVSSSSHSSKHFPTEILLNILSRVPAKSLFRFRCVSKLFCKLINDSSLAAMHLHHTDMIEEPSVVMIHSRTITSRGPALLCNPLRGEAIELPHCNVNALYRWEEWYGLGVDATSSTYQIVNVVFRIDRSYVVHVHVLGTSSWKQISAVPPCGLIVENALWVCSVTIYGGVSRKRFRYGNGRVEGNFVPKIFSYTGSLVSLKDYSKLLVEGSKAEQSKAWLSGNAIS
ncbi:hypothetical protein ACLB2K_067670 [Fragaria x ananassa]